MPDIVWGGLQVDEGTVTSTQTGSQPGPQGGDGWTLVGYLPKAKLQSNRRYAFLVSGTIRNRQVVGSTPVHGLCQVALGDASGLVNPFHCFELGLNWPITPGGGAPFQFLVLFDQPNSGVVDLAWGATWPNTEDLALYARAYTNGDQQNYAATFDVTGVSWLWIDLEAMPSTRFFIAEHSPASPVQQSLTGSFVDHHLTAGMPGAAGEQWACFSQLVYAPLSTTRTEFQFGTTATTSLFDAIRIGTRQWGGGLRGAPYDPTRRPAVQHWGSFCNVSRPSGTVRWGYRGDGDAMIYRWRLFCLRVDELPEVSALSLTDQPDSAGTMDPTIQLLHEPPPMTGYVAQPIYLAHAIGFSWSAGQPSFQLRLVTNRGRVVADGIPVKSMPGEGIPIFAAGELGLGRGEGVRYENTLARLQSVSTLPWWADDVEMLQLWLVQDPTIDPPDPYPTLDPVYVVPAREGVSIAAQAALPIAPAESVTMDVALPESQIVGVTGVRRRWPLFTAPRRTWVMTWPALRDAEKQTLQAFLRANVTFKWRPPQESAELALLAPEPAAFEMLDPAGPTWSCRLTVVELVFVGGA